MSFLPAEVPVGWWTLWTRFAEERPGLPCRCAACERSSCQRCKKRYLRQAKLADWKHVGYCRAVYAPSRLGCECHRGFAASNCESPAFSKARASRSTELRGSGVQRSAFHRNPLCLAARTEIPERPQANRHCVNIRQIHLQRSEDFSPIRNAGVGLSASGSRPPFETHRRSRARSARDFWARR